MRVISNRASYSCRPVVNNTAAFARAANVGYSTSFKRSTSAVYNSSHRSEQSCRTVPAVTRAIRLEAIFPVTPLRSAYQSKQDAFERPKGADA